MCFKLKIMNIEKALSHFEWKFKNSWKPTSKDIEAYNSILEWKELQESIVFQENELLAKLWIEKLITLSETKMYSGERSIQVIDEILNKSVYEMVCILKSKLSVMRFNAILNENDILNQIDILNEDKWLSAANKIIDNNPDKLKDALIDDIKEKNVIKFVEKQINRIINKYEK